VELNRASSAPCASTTANVNIPATIPKGVFMPEFCHAGFRLPSKYRQPGRSPYNQRALQAAKHGSHAAEISIQSVTRSSQTPG